MLGPRVAAIVIAADFPIAGRVVFEELLPTFSRYEVAAPVEWGRSNRHTGIRHLRVRLGR